MALALDGVCVVYSDYNGRWRPLDELYFSTDSRCLVSNHPESMQEDVESFYCPQCNFFCVEAEAQGYLNRLAKLFSAAPPAAAAAAPQRAGCRFGCPHCNWSSDQQGLVEDDADALAMTAMQLEREDPLSHHFAALLSCAQRGTAAAAAAARGRSVLMLPPAGSSLSSAAAAAAGAASHEGPRWCVANLEARL
ncbi:unnamed protein product, partial [Phaeothamnion confervicola]